MKNHVKTSSAQSHRTAADTDVRSPFIDQKGQGGMRLNEDA